MNLCENCIYADRCGLYAATRPISVKNCIKFKEIKK